MNKRNNLLAIIVLVMLVVLLLVGKGCVHLYRNTVHQVRSVSKVDCLLDLNMATGFDSATVQACNLPIVIHYPTKTNVNGSRTKLHIFSLTPDALKTLFLPDTSGLATDSTRSIHIYTKFLRSKTSSVNLWFYNTLHLKEEVSYVVTFPVRDSTGLHVVVDSGLVSSEMSWKAVGVGSKSTSKQDSERDMTESLEKNLIRDVAKKIKPN